MARILLSDWLNIIARKVKLIRTRLTGNKAPIQLSSQLDITLWSLPQVANCSQIISYGFVLLTAIFHINNLSVVEKRLQKELFFFFLQKPRL